MNEETKEVIEEDDIIMPDDLEDTPIEEESDNEENQDTKENQPEKPETPTAEPEDEDKKFLEYLNKKGIIKFNGENVQVKDINDLVSNYQKGLNYDRVTTRENVVMDYIKEKANSLNISPEEYISQVKKYEQDRKKESQEADIQRYVNKGIDEDTAREIVQTRLAREEFEKEKAEYQKRIAEAEQKKNEEKEYEDFIKEHSDIKAEDIPPEVFEKAKEVGLNNAFNAYENKLLKEKIKQMEQNQKNASSSPVGLTSEGSPTEQLSKDAFLEGFDSE